MTKNTFKMLRKKMMPDPLDPTKWITVRRWKTLIDRPAYKVKKGDVTGWIDAKLIPEGDGECWFGYNTFLYGKVQTTDNVKILDNAIVRGPSFNSKSKLYILEDAVISGNAIVGAGDYRNDGGQDYTIKGQAEITGNASVGLPELIQGNVIIRDSSTVGKMAKFDHDVEIYDQAEIGDNVSLRGHIHVHESSKIGDRVSVIGELNADGDSEILPEAIIANGVVKSIGTSRSQKRVLDELPQAKNLSLLGSSHSLEGSRKTTSRTGKISKVPDSGFQEISKSQSPYAFWMDKIKTTKAKIDSYEMDIVKIIKFPVMVDLTDVHTANMVFALRDVEAAMHTNGQDLIQAATELERKFLIAESNARKIAGTKFTEEELKKTEQARDLFALACNDATSENEKYTAFKQGFKRLEGIVAIPERTVEAMRIKVGIAEIEM